MPSINLNKPPQNKWRKKNNRKPQGPLPFDVALRKFKKSVEAAGIIQEVRKREFYEKPTAKRRRKKAEAVARWKKKERMLKLNGYPESRRRR